MSVVQAEAIGALPARTRELTNAGLCDQVIPPVPFLFARFRPYSYLAHLPAVSPRLLRV